MKDMLDKILQIEKKYNELGVTLSDPAVIQDYNKFRDLSKQRKSMEETVELYYAWKKAVDAIDDEDIPNLREELGDVLLQVVLHAQIAKDNNEFDIEDVAKELSEKLIHRHPHVFGNQKVESTQDIIDNWDKLKKEEKTYRKSVLDGISKSQSALMSAQKISKKVVKVGFEWDSVDSLKNCIKSEYKEFEEAVKEGDKDHMEDEMGDIFFATVNLARWYKIDAEQALLRANK